MAEELRCPDCSELVPGTGGQHRGGTGPGALKQPWKQDGECPNCGAKLQRMPEATDPSWYVRCEE